MRWYAPGRLDLDMGVVVDVGVEQLLEPGDLLVGEQPGAGVQGASRDVERVALVAAVAMDGLLDPAATPVQCVAGQADDVEGVHDRDGVGKFLAGGGLEAAEPVHRDHLHAVAPLLGPVGEPGLERLLGASLDHVEEPGGAGAVAYGGEVDDHGHVLLAAPGVAPDVFVNANDTDAVEAVLVLDQDPPAFVEDRVVRGVPGHVEPLGDPGHREVLDHERLQCPPQRAA